MNQAVIRSIVIVVAAVSMVGICAPPSERLEKIVAAEPANSPPPKALTDDPLYQAIIGELRGARQSLDAGTEEKANDEKSSVKSDGKAGMTRDDWRAVELMLRAARLLEKNAHDANSEKPDEHRAKLASMLRNNVTEFVKVRP